MEKMLKSMNVKWIFVAIVVVFLLWAIMTYSSGKSVMMDNYANIGIDTNTDYNSAYSPTLRSRKAKPDYKVDTVPAEPVRSRSNSYNAQNVANPTDLLPVDQNSQWAALNPVNNKNPKIPDMLQAGNLIGLDTIGQTMKNANLQLRSDPIITKQNVGPWNNSTYEPDFARVPLELGQGKP
jgi:hypothetical protein